MVALVTRYHNETDDMIFRIAFSGRDELFADMQAAVARGQKINFDVDRRPSPISNPEFTISILFGRLKRGSTGVFQNWRDAMEIRDRLDKAFNG